jgi:hypothetical protein
MRRFMTRVKVQRVALRGSEWQRSAMSVPQNSRNLFVICAAVLAVMELSNMLDRHSSDHLAVFLRRIPN